MLPRDVAPLKNSTLLIETPVTGAAVAVAVSEIVAPGAKLALFAGAVIATVGGTSAVIETACEVEIPPALSVAFAVSE